MAEGGIRVEVDLSNWERFVQQAPDEVERAAKTFYERGSLIMRRQMIQQAVRRFGRETSESQMQSYDPTRPKGQWSGSVRAATDKKGVRVGPAVPYAWWVERGRNAPRGVPGSHRSSNFVGHRPVERGALDSVEPIERLLLKVIADAIDRATD